MSLVHLLLAHWLCCAIMTGVIWVVQLVHYPTFLWIDKSKFRDFVRFHGRQISFIVLPVMVAELVTAGLLIWLTAASSWAVWNGIGVGALWVVTITLSIPCHAKLADGFQKPIVDRLIATNWLRTIIWTARTIGLSIGPSIGLSSALARLTSQAAL